MTHREAHATATRRGHKMLKWQINPYHDGLLCTHCRKCGATLIENGGDSRGTFSGNTLRRDCASIMASKRRTAREVRKGLAVRD